MKPIANTVPLYQRLQETEAKLDAQEAQLHNLAKRAKERLASENETAETYQRKCKYLERGMTLQEVEKVLGTYYVDETTGRDPHIIYKYMNSEGDSGSITIRFAFNRLVSSLYGCQGKSF